MTQTTKDPILTVEQPLLFSFDAWWDKSLRFLLFKSNYFHNILFQITISRDMVKVGKYTLAWYRKYGGK